MCSLIGGTCSNDCEDSQRYIHARCDGIARCCVPKNEYLCSQLGGRCQYTYTCNVFKNNLDRTICGDQAFDIACCIPKQESMWRIMFDILASCIVGLLSFIMIVKLGVRIKSKRDALRKANEYNLLYDADDATESDWLDKFITDFIGSIYRIERLKIGALVVIQHKEDLSLEDLCQDGEIMDGRFAPKILESIFSKDTPLHDGAVVIRIAQGAAKIYAANVIIPNLSSRNTPGLSPDMNTRHRSAMAFNDRSNSTFVVVVSEKEHVAVVRNGEIQQNVNQDSMSALLKNHLNPFFPISQSAPEQIMSPSTSGTTNEMVNGDQNV